MGWGFEVVNHLQSQTSLSKSHAAMATAKKQNHDWMKSTLPGETGSFVCSKAADENRQAANAMQV
jgi:hypothetical protein